MGTGDLSRNVTHGKWNLHGVRLPPGPWRIRGKRQLSMRSSHLGEGFLLSWVPHLSPYPCREPHGSGGGSGCGSSQAIRRSWHTSISCSGSPRTSRAPFPLGERDLLSLSGTATWRLYDRAPTCPGAEGSVYCPCTSTDRRVFPEAQVDSLRSQQSASDIAPSGDCATLRRLDIAGNWRWHRNISYVLPSFCIRLWNGCYRRMPGLAWGNCRIDSLRAHHGARSFRAGIDPTAS